jgi:hypothetical protein
MKRYNIYRNQSKMLRLGVSFKEAKEKINRLKYVFEQNKASVTADRRGFTAAGVKYQIRLDK